MNTMQTSMHTLAGLTIAAFLEAQAGSAPPGGRQVGIGQSDTATYLLWQSQSNATYEIQDKTNLRQSAWSPVANVDASGPETAWPIPLADSPSRFFRVLFPQPTILAGEPAYGPLAGGVTVYITGTHFYEGDLIRVGGVLLSNIVFLSPTLLSGVLPALPDPGLYDIDVISGAGGAILAVLPQAFEVAPPLERRLQELPEWPPAGPAPALAEYRGHVTVLKAAALDPGHVTVLKAAALDPGHVTVLKAAALDPGHVTVLKAAALDPGHVTVLKAAALDPGHVTVLKGHDNDCDGTPELRLHSGEVQQQVADLAVPGRGLDFVWVRTYRSRTGTATAQGTRWTHSYDVRCVRGEGAFDVYDGTGRKDAFRLQANGTYTCPGFFREGTFSNSAFRLTFADTGFWEFNPSDSSPAAGKLARIQDRNGNAVTCAYDGSGRLSQVTDTLGRAFTLAYTPEGRVASVTDFTGRAVTYAYYSQGESGGNAGDLKSVTSPPVTGTPNGNDFPLGKTVAYTYTTGYPDPRQNSLMLSITDPLGQTASRCVYELDSAAAAFLRCKSVQRGAEPPACVTYVQQSPSPENRFAAVRCIVNDPVGNVSEASFDSRNRCVTLREFTGRAVAGLPVSDKENRPAGKLRADDPDRFETQYSWNSDGLCLGASLPGGNVLSCAYEADLNPSAPPRKRADLRAFRQHAGSGPAADSDGDGVPDLTEIACHYTYDPRFGSDPSRKGWDGSIKGNKGINETLPDTMLRKGWDGTVKGGKRFGIGVASPEAPLGSGSARIITDRDSGRSKGFGFVTSAIDPLGTETTGEYDAHGNLTRAVIHVLPVSHPPVIDLAYDTHGQLTGVTQPEDAAGRRKVDAFSWSQGLVTQVVEDAAPDGLALTTVFERDARGNVTRVVDPRGFETLYTYNALNQPVTVAKQTQGATFGEKVNAGLAYDANDNLVQVDVDNRAPDGTLDPVNPRWTTAYGYDALNRQTLLAHELAHTVQQRVMTNLFVYDANDNLVLHRLPEAASGADPHNEIAYAYDERGLPFQEERAPGTGLSTTDTYDYDGNGNCRRISKIDAFTIKQTVMAYDGFDRCVRTTDAMSNTLTRAFDASGRLVFERVDGETDDAPGGALNRRLAETRCAYDPLNRLTGRSYSFFDVFTELSIGDGSSTDAFAYAPNGQLLSQTDDNGNTTRYSYDSAGRLATVTDPKNNAVQCSYDACDNITALRETDLSDVSAGEQVFVCAFTYDGLGRCLTDSDNVGNTNRYAYDSRGNCVSAIDPHGNETACVYDGLGRATETTHYVGAKERGITINTSHVEYRNSRCVSVTDGNGNTTAYAYDACDRQTETVRPDGTVESLVWSPRSNLELRIDPNGTAVTNRYDLLDRLVHRDIAASEGVAPTTTFEAFAYDGLGRLVAAANDGSSLALGYDSLGNCVTADEGGRVTRYSYDGVGNRLSTVCPGGRAILATYDALDRVSAISTIPFAGGALAGLATFAYDGPDRLAKITRANGVNTRVFWNGTLNPANAAGDFGWQQAARVNHARASGGQVVDQRTSAYDRSQDKTRRAMTAPWSSGGPLTVNTYGYDRLHRLTRGTRVSGSADDYARTYVLDANGNRLQVTNNGIPEAYTMDASLPEPADFQMDQYTQTPFGAEAHDANGNRTASVSPTGSTLYRYDYADRLVQVDKLNGDGSVAPVAAYSYDPLGRRIGKTVFASGGLPSETMAFVFGDDCDDTDRTPLESYKNGKVSSVSALAGGAGGGAAAASYAATGRMLQPPLVIFGAAGEAYYTHCDELGNVLALTDAAGAIVEHYDYEEFGMPSFFDGSGNPLPASSVGMPVLFHGLFWDAETGLYSRSGDNPLFQENGNSGQNPFYDPKTGRSLGDATQSPLYDDKGREVQNPLYKGHRDVGGYRASVQEGKKGLNAVNVKLARTTDVTGEIELPAGRSVIVRGWDPEKKNAISSRMKNGTVKFFNEAKGFGRSVSNVLKTKHDTAKNSVGNIR